MKALFLVLMLSVSSVGYSMASCIPKPEPSSTPCEGTWRQDPAPATFTAYVKDSGAPGKCTKKVEGTSGGHCKSTLGYNGCSDNPTTCCHKKGAERGMEDENAE